MTIMDELKGIAKRVGITTTGDTIQEIIESFKKGLDEKEKFTKKTSSPSNDYTTNTTEETYNRSKDRNR